MFTTFEGQSTKMAGARQIDIYEGPRVLYLQYGLADGVALGDRHPIRFFFLPV